MKLCRSCVVAVLALPACASSTHVSTSHAAAGAQNAISTAEGAGAAQTPQAEQHLRLAQDQYAIAQRLVQRGAPAQANAMLVRAQGDAELALSLAREASVQAEARQVDDRIRALSTATSAPQP
jgi:hypothetical protein